MLAPEANEYTNDISSDHERVTLFRYPDGTEHFEKIKWYNNMTISLVFWDDVLISIQIPVNSNFYFNGINLTNIDYRDTIKKLSKLGYGFTMNQANYEYKFDDLNLFLLLETEDELQCAGIYSTKVKQIEEMNKRYKSKRLMQDGLTVIEFADIYA